MNGMIIQPKIWFVLVAATMWGMLASTAQETARRPYPFDPQVVEARSLGLMLERSPEEQQRFVGLVQESNSWFKKLEVNSEFGTHRFQFVDLNKDRVGFDGIRFRVPEDGARDLVWMMAFPPTSKFNWFVHPVSGTMATPTVTFSQEHSEQYRKQAGWGRNMDPLNAFIQGIGNGGLFEPGREYVIWFAFERNEAAPSYVGLNLLKPERPLKSVDDWERAMGFDLNYQPVPARPGTLAHAHELLLARIESNWFSGQEAYEDEIRLLGESFHEVKINEVPGTNRFHRVSLNRTGVGVDGIRFKVPSDGEGRELLWMFACPRQEGVFHRWFIIPAKGLPPVYYDGLISDRSIEPLYHEIAPWGAEGRDYLIALQAMRGGFIQPGGEYFIAFHTTGTEPRDSYIAINLLPKGTPLVTPIQMEKAMGFDWERY